MLRYSMGVDSASSLADQPDLNHDNTIRSSSDGGSQSRGEVEFRTLLYHLRYFTVSYVIGSEG